MRVDRSSPSSLFSLVIALRYYLFGPGWWHDHRRGRQLLSEVNACAYGRSSPGASQKLKRPFARQQPAPLKEFVDGAFFVVASCLCKQRLLLLSSHDSLEDEETMRVVYLELIPALFGRVEPAGQ